MHERELKSLLDQVLERDTKLLYKSPNTTEHWYGKDQPENVKPGGKGVGRCSVSNHIQNVDWSNEVIEYNFNSMGLRCPELEDRDTKILFAGGSFMLGTGVRMEQSFPWKLSKLSDASYINLSDSDSLLGLLQPILDTCEWYKPNYLILGDTRFVDEYGWFVRLTRAKISKHLDRDTRDFMMNIYEGILNKRNYNSVYLMLSHLRHKLDIPIYFMISNRKDFKFDKDIYVPGVEILNCSWEEDGNFVDLARDNTHPGPLSHDNITLELYDLMIRSS